MNRVLKQLIAASAFAATIVPATGHAGTRASDPTPAAASKSVASAAAAPAQPTPGPKGGFPPAPGLEIAKIKANDNAAFKRKSGGT
jgi:hypothetical protein